MSWIKLPRTIMKSPVFKHPNTLKVWLWCLIKAGHRATVLNMQFGSITKAVELAAGEFVYSRKNGAAEVQMPVTSFGRELLKLEDMGHIKVMPRRRYSIIQLKTDVPKPTEKRKKNTLHQARHAANKPLTDEEITNAMLHLQKHFLPQLMADLYIYSHPETIRASYQTYLQKKPRTFTTMHELQVHLQQYLLAEWV